MNSANAETALTIRRIVVALHPSPHSRAALEQAARLAAFLEVELRGMYVEEEALLRLAELKFLQEVDAVLGEIRGLETADLERQLRAEAARVHRELARIAHEFGVEWSFRVSRGEVSAQLVEAAAQMDLVMLGVRTRQTGRGLGSTVRSLIADPGRPVMIIRHGMQLTSDVHVVDDGTDAGKRAAELGRALTGRPGSALTIHVGGEEDRTARRLETYREKLRGTRENVALRPLDVPEGLGIAAPLTIRSCGLLILPRTVLGGDVRALNRLLRHAACPILVV